MNNGNEGEEFVKTLYTNVHNFLFNNDKNKLVRLTSTSLPGIYGI